ncbi:MAG: hypothetical protein ABSA80_15605 [Terriglobales bacterium]
MLWPRAIFHPPRVLTNTMLSTPVISQLTLVACDKHSLYGLGRNSNSRPSALSALLVESMVTVTHATSPCT